MYMHCPEQVLSKQNSFVVKLTLLRHTQHAFMIISIRHNVHTSIAHILASSHLNGIVTN